MSLGELAEAVNAWCAEHGVEPMNGQAAASLNERSIRYYRTLGLLGPSDSGAAGRSYSERHFLQLVAIRLLQARGLPLRRIQELLYERTLAELREIQRRGVEELPAKSPASTGDFFPGEKWQVLSLTTDFALISRSGRMPPPEQIEAIRNLLSDQKSGAFPASAFQPTDHETRLPE